MSVESSLLGGVAAPVLTGDVLRVDGPVGLPGRITVDDVAIKDLGTCRLPSPVAAHLDVRALHFVGEADKVLVNDCLSNLGGHAGQLGDLPAFELAGPRNRIFFDPCTVRCGIVTCGGLCPGLNNVVRGLVLELAHGYTIRSVPASPSDSVYCWNMARNAVHAAMAGNTEMLIGRWHGRFVHVPMALAARSRKQVDPTDDLWMSVIEATGQPKAFV
jgi:hypothetical protein